MKNIIKSIGNGFTSLFFHNSVNDPIVRLFQTEYGKEYRMLKRLGVTVDRALALEHMNLREGGKKSC